MVQWGGREQEQPARLELPKTVGDLVKSIGSFLGRWTISDEKGNMVLADEFKRRVLLEQLEKKEYGALAGLPGVEYLRFTGVREEETEEGKKKIVYWRLMNGKKEIKADPDNIGQLIWLNGFTKQVRNLKPDEAKRLPAILHVYLEDVK